MGELLESALRLDTRIGKSVMAKGPLVAVDIGLHSVKMLALKRTRKGVAVVGAASQPLELPSKSSPDEIAQRTAEVIKSVKKSLSKGGKRAAVSLGGGSAFSRYVKVPVPM